MTAAAASTPSPRPVTRVSESRLRLLGELVRHRATGRTIEELSSALAVSRTAIHQHLTALERDGLVVHAARRSTGGRPSRSYTISDAGLELFPRGYARMATSLLRHTRELFGEAGQSALLDSMAQELAEEMRGRLAGLTGTRRLAEVVAILNELGYDARHTESGAIAASNCIFHQVAVSDRAACGFDRRLLGLLLESDVEQDGCIVDGRDCCLFRLRGEHA